MKQSMTQSETKRSESGFGLAEVLVAAGLLSVVALGVVKIIGVSFSSSNKVSSSLDITGIRANIQEAVSCAASFPGTPPCVAGTYVPIKAKNGSVLVAAGGTVIGNWVVLAKCTSTGIDMRAASMVLAHRLDPAARNFAVDDPAFFRADEMDSTLRYNWTHPKAQLFLGNSSAGLCSHLFGAGSPPVMCAANQYLKGVNFGNNTVECENIPTCPPETASSWNGTAFVCVPARTDGYIVSNIVNPLINSNNTTYVNPHDVTTFNNAVTTAKSQIKAALGTGDVLDKTYSSWSDCASLSRMTCPPGYFMYGYEHKQEPGQNCRTRCVRFLP